MNTVVFFTGAGLLFVVWYCHILLWRLSLPRRPILVLLLIFLIAPLVMLPLAAPWCTDIAALVRDPWALVQLTVFYVPCFFCYLIAYTLLEQDSPSLTIIKEIARVGNGCEEAQLVQRFHKSGFLEIRLARMVDGGLLNRENNHFTLTAQGRSWARIFALVASLAGIHKGG